MERVIEKGYSEKFTFTKKYHTYKDTREKKIEVRRGGRGKISVSSRAKRETKKKKRKDSLLLIYTLERKIYRHQKLFIL